MSKELDYIAELERENRLLGERCNQLLKDKGGLTDKVKILKEENNKLLDVINNQDVKIADLEQKLEQTEKDLADYQFNYPTIKELEKENEMFKKANEIIAQQRDDRDVDISILEKRIEELELELTVEKDQLQEEINLHLHAEDYIKSLEKENAELKTDNDARKFAMAMSEKVEKQLREENAELKEQIEKMKCCFNCKYSRTEYEHCRTDKHEKWEIEK